MFIFSSIHNLSKLYVFLFLFDMWGEPQQNQNSWQKNRAKIQTAQMRAVFVQKHFFRKKTLVNFTLIEVLC